MDIIVKISDKNYLEINRELYCDLCNDTLNTINSENSENPEFIFYAVFFLDTDNSLYLEKYICQNCLRHFRSVIFFEFKKAPYPLQEAIRNNLKESHHGYIVSGDSFEDFVLFLKNPELIRLFGKRF